MKIKYAVSIPRPSANRMKGTGKIYVNCGSGWDFGPIKEYPLNPDQAEFEFEVDSSYEWINATSTNDGPVFDVYVEYINSTGSRKEKFTLVPRKVE